jgi:plastocyanin
MRRRLLITILTTALLAGACGGGDTNQRRVLVDFSHDEFATFVAENFPKAVTVRPGQTIEFKQTWTGEPHTVTGGTLVNDSLKKGSVWLQFFSAFEALNRSGENVPDPETATDMSFAEWAGIVKSLKAAGPRDTFVGLWSKLRSQGVALPDFANPPNVPLAEVNKQVDTLSESAFQDLLFASDDNGNIVQNVGQPCYLGTGGPPEAVGTACTKAEQRQPAFDGTQSFYNSGIIKYEGAGGNSYRVKLADDIKPGTYYFYCAIHGPGQLSEVTVRPKGAKVPSQAQVSKQARTELDAVTQPLAEVYKQATTKGEIRLQGDTVKGPFAGLVTPGQDHAGINEFVPKVLRAKVNEPITWHMMGADHTITFNVPRYFPIVDFNAPGGIRYNPKLRAAAGGAPEPKQQDGQGVLKVDGGTYSGDGFWSTGLVGATPYLEYTLRIAKPGTYNYACLVHPPMVGKLIVS